MKTPRELILERHQSAETKLKAIRAEDLAACARSAAQANCQAPPAFDFSTAVVKFWQETFWPWRRAWIISRARSASRQKNSSAGMRRAPSVKPRSL